VKAVVPGSYDPLTLGHLDVVTRAARLFDEVVVAVGVNNTKSYLFEMDTRLALATEALSGLDNVSVLAMKGLLVDFCHDQQADVVVRGARSGADFEAEWAMAAMNASLGNVETLVLPSAPQVGFLSSTLVRSVARAGGTIAAYVPANVAMAMEKE
jgi:pantetheine-phosphate adenylyltransferase